MANSNVVPMIDNSEAVDAFPSMEERPCFRVYDNWVVNGSKKRRPGLYWHTSKKENEKLIPIDEWISSPIHIEANTSDKEDNNHGRLLKFISVSGYWKKWAMPMGMLAGDATEVRRELLDRGLTYHEKNKNKLTEYIASHPITTMMEIATKTGWYDGVFVLPDRVIGNEKENIWFQSYGRVAAYSQGGTLEGWRDTIGKYAIDNPNIMLAVCTAFAGVLLHRVNHQGGGIHLFGDSSTGKTTALYASASVWGGQSFVRTWRTTSNALEGAARMHNDTLLVLDEIGEIRPKELNEAVYSLINGSGKSRADKLGEPREVSKWQVFVFSTGEQTISAHIESEGSTKSKAGQSIRILDIPVQGKYGVFNELHGKPSGASLSQTIKDSANKHYGHAGIAFVEYFIKHLSEGEELAEKVNYSITLLGGGNSLNGQETRAAKTLAMVLTAGHIGIEAGILPWEKESLESAIFSIFGVWKGERGAMGQSSEHTTILTLVRDFIDKYGESRFSDLDIIKEVNERLPTTHNLAGYTELQDGKRVYMFTAGGLKEATKPFSTARVNKALLQTGAIIKHHDGQPSKSVKINGRNVRVYFVEYDKLGE